MTADQLFDALNEQLSLHGLTPYPERYIYGLRKSLNQLIRWCRERGYDPERWVVSKHNAIGWRHRIPPRKMATASAKFIEAFEAWGDTAAAEFQAQATMLGTAQEDTRSGLTFLGEILKRTWVGDRQTCLEAPETWFATASRWCAGCPAQGDCRARS